MNKNMRNLVAMLLAGSLLIVMVAFGQGFASATAPAQSNTGEELDTGNIIADSPGNSGIEMPGVQVIAGGSFDLFLKLDGIEGESTDSRHKGEIEIESFSWGETNGARGRTSGKVNMQDFQFVMRFNKASPKLFLAAASGEHIKSAVLTIRRAGKEQQEFLKWKLTDLMVTSYQTGGRTDAAPTDQFSLSFTKIEVEYRQQKPDGTLGEPIKAGWDVKLNKKI